MHHHRPLCVPAPDEIDQLAHVALAGQHHAVRRLDDVVDAEEEVVLAGIDRRGRATGVSSLIRLTRWLAREAATVAATWESGQT